MPVFILLFAKVNNNALYISIGKEFLKLNLYLNESAIPKQYSSNLKKKKKKKLRHQNPSSGRK